MLKNTLRTLFVGVVSTAIGLGVTVMATSASPAFAYSSFSPAAISVL